MTQRLQNLGWVMVAAIVLYWAATTLVGTVFSGPLDPPAPPAETQKGQITSIPHTITAPGSYVVMADLNCTTCTGGGDHGITITSSNVTLDLNGFRVKGPGPGLSSGAGIFVSGTRSNVTIKNGLVRDWIGTSGVFLADCSRCRVEHIVSSDNLTGISVSAGGAGVIEDVNATANTLNGIVIVGTGGWLVTDSMVRNNGMSGALINSNGNVIRDNVVRTNGVGIWVSAGNVGNTIEGNSSNANGSSGINVDGTNNMIVRNNARSNSSGNYDIAAGNHVGPIISGPDDPIASSNPWANHEY